MMLQIIFLGTILFVAFSFDTKSNCDPETLLKNCASDLDDFVFIKSFPVETNKTTEKTEYSYVLSRAITYRIVVCTQNEADKKMVVNLYDRNKKLIASNYLKSSKKFFPTINYTCSATGVYYVEAFFDGDKKGCGLNILGFKK
ncbi:MAG: hypothetical protein V4677_01740 [Bacteroidota bacterium]